MRNGQLSKPVKQQKLGVLLGTGGSRGKSGSRKQRSRLRAWPRRPSKLSKMSGEHREQHLAFLKAKADVRKVEQQRTVTVLNS